MTLKEAYAEGFQSGKNCASWQELPEMGSTIRPFTVPDFIGKIETVNDAQEVFTSICFEAEDNSRQYSPFEFTASAINKSRNADRLWEEYDRGVSEGISKNWQDRSANYYSAE